MGLQITRMLVPAYKYSLKCPNAMMPIGVTVHETGNIATAMSEASYMVGNNSQTSFHFVVDNIRAIQTLPLDRNGWHAGDGRNGRGNARTIGVEHCYNWDGKATTKNSEKYNPLYQKSLENGIELVANLFISHPQWGTPQAGVNIWRHKDQSGKNCPQRMIEEGYWSTYVAKVKARYLELKTGKKVEPVVVKATTETGKLSIDGLLGPSTIIALQKHFGTPQDGKLSDPSMVVKAIQKLVGATADGYTGPNTIKAMQKYLGTPQDGILSKPSMMVKELQRRLNAGTLGTAKVPVAKATTAKKPSIMVDGLWGPSTTKYLQSVLGTPADGIISRQSSNAVTQNIGGVKFGSGGSMVVKALQKKIGVSQDGLLGPNTIKALQRYLGTPQDGKLSKPSMAVKALQRKLNTGKL